LLKCLITPELVAKKLEKLNVNKCPDLDGIHPRVLFELKKDLARPLSFFCSFLEFGVIPADWKMQVLLLFKKGKSLNSSKSFLSSNNTLGCIPSKSGIY